MTTVAFVRPRERLADGETQCRAAGFEPIDAPSMDILHGEPAVYREVETLLESNSVLYTVFGSITAVEECHREYGDRLVPLLQHTRVVCTGPSTAAHLERIYHRAADLIPRVYSSEEIAREIAPEVQGKTVLLLRSGSGEQTIVRMMKEAGADVHDCAVYRLQQTDVTPELTELITAIGRGNVDAILFTSPMSASQLILRTRAQLGNRADECLRKTFRIAIGKPTAAALERQHLPADALPQVSTFAGMLATVREHFGN
ncbi:MAG: uroporphyrinogen-III synthase [Candidatus Methanomethylophilus sp.]|nr:uroporphyrinogen-III synthase [Methanomethylophilus sp.]MDD3232921.1 uroporphyrinogen-III synthase [Methanomethylophilus sp.]MDD4221959.1 uroporphyrinogen-III synthase [Methanomethylophilus sp.]MDD4668700.1 uroporphyrinogen-III synthase [Methanomethylophilus sp.]